MKVMQNILPRLGAVRLWAVVSAMLACLLAAPAAGAANRLNDKVLNRPYADMRRFHLGFSIGLNTFGMSFHHNGFVTDDGKTWFMSQPSYSPGFCVNGLMSLRLNNYFSLRFSPGMWFGNSVVKFRDTSNTDDTPENPAQYSQNLKSAYVVLPIDLKFASQRMCNLRPYVTGGVMPVFNVANQRSDILMLNKGNIFLTAGFGCDIYLPYFKFIPEVKFCFGLGDVLKKDRPDLDEDPTKMNIAKSVKRATTQMIVFTFYFE